MAIADEHTPDVLRYEFCNLVLGELLGSGGFSSVYSIHEKKKKAIVKNLELVDATSCTDDSSSASSSSAESSVELHHNDGDAEMALKTLHKKTLKTTKRAERGLQDLKMEVSILMMLPFHANIIKFHGISSDFYDSPENAFMVLERLDEPLDKALLRWKDQAAKDDGNGILRRLHLRKSPKSHLSEASQADRIDKVAIDLASALGFIHQHRVVYRDLKPANIGFDNAGKVKLFDFACAKILAQGETLKSRCGTLRYMSPECARREPYDFATDVYSFGMVLWELCALEKPYKNASDKADLAARVTRPGKHPDVKSISSPFLQYVHQSCWSDVPSQRPTFGVLEEWLRKEVQNQRKNQE